ncbi:Ig-like domain-containing protein [Lactobacillus jensenii]|uniref:Ig-like domain-containing protein n=2 Tax=Lactobacillus jensenii TaxID=109790 RepID=A0ABU9FJJ1_LACJE
MGEKDKRLRYSLRKMKKGGAASFVIGAVIFLSAVELNSKNVYAAEVSSAEASQSQSSARAVFASSSASNSTVAHEDKSQSTSIFISKPTVSEVFVGDTAIKGKTRANAQVVLYKGDNQVQTTSADAEGGFTFNLTNAVSEKDNYSVQAEVDGSQSEKTVISPIVHSNTKPLANERNAYTPFDVSLANRGFKYDDAKHESYIELNLALGLLSEAYLDLNNAKMFYQIDPALAPYIDKIVFSRALLSDGEATKDTSNEVPGATNVWTSGVLTTQNGPIRAALAGSTSSTYKIYLKADTPNSILSKPLSFTMWARYSSGHDMVSDFSKNLILNDNETTTFSSNNFFKSLDIVNNDGPILDNMSVDYSNKTVNTRYRVNGSLLGDKSNLTLRIRGNDNLLKLIDKVKISNKTYTLANNTLKYRTGELYINDIGGSLGFLSSLSNRQDFNVTFYLKNGKSFADALTSESQKFDFQFGIYDTTDYATAFHSLDTVTNSLSTKTYTTGDKYNNQTYDLSTFKTILDKLIKQKQDNPTTYLSFEDKKISATENNPYEAVKLALESPTFTNISIAKSLVNAADCKQLDNTAKWAWDNGARDDLLKYLDVATKVASYIHLEFPTKPTDFSGLLLRYTRAGTFISAVDSDRDGVLDITEIDNSYGMNPSVYDTDGDGISDGQELREGRDPGVAPFNWTDANGNQLSIDVDTTTISGQLGNHNYHNEVMQPRTVNLYKVDDTGKKTLIAYTTSAVDQNGSFTLSKFTLNKGDKLVIGYVTPRTNKSLTDKDTILQQAFPTEQFSNEIIVKGKQVTVTFNMNGVSDDENQDIKVEKDSSFNKDSLTLPTPTMKTGYSFKEWNTQADGKGTVVTADTIFDTDTTVYAIGEKIKLPNPTNIKAETRTDDKTKSQETIITGKATPGATVTIKDNLGNEIGTGVANDAGNFEIKTTSPLAEATKVSVEATKGGESSDAVEATVEQNNFQKGNPLIQPASPTAVTAVTIKASDGTNNSTTVTGKAAAGETVTVKDSSGNEIGTGVVGEDGTFTITTNKPIAENERIQVVVTKDDAESEPTEAVVTAKTEPTNPTEVTAKTLPDGNSDSTIVAGKGKAGEVVTVKNDAGKVIGTGKVSDDGTFSIKTDEVIEPGKQVSVITTNDGMDSIPVPVTVSGETITSIKQSAKAAVDNLTYLNNAQKQSAKDAIDSANTVDEITTAKNNAVSTDTNMKDLSEDTKLAADKTQDPYLNADLDKKQAYDKAVEEAQKLLNKETGTSVGADKDPAEVARIKQAVDDAYDALNGNSSLDDAKQKAKDAVDKNYTNLNDKQKETAKKRIDSAKSEDEVNNADKINSGLNEKMGELKEVSNLSDKIETTSNYSNADSDKKQAYKETADKIHETVAPSGDDLTTDDVNNLITDEATKRAALNGDAREKARQELENNYNSGKSLQDGSTLDPKYYNASEEKKQAFQKALDNAKKALDNSETTEAEYKSANDELQKAKADLDGQTTDKSKLDEAITDANNTKLTDKYNNASDDTKSKFDEALKKAENVKNDSNATQKEVDDATNNLKQAQNDLDGQTTDKSKLDEAITDANNTKSTDKYNNASDDTKSKFDEALKKAEEVKNNSNATQKEVDDATNNLTQAQNNLDGQTTDKSKLDEAITDANNTKSTDKYKNASDDTKSKFDDALKKAEEVKNNSNATQKEVDDATNNLKQAQNDLDGQTTNKDTLNDAIKDANDAKGTDKYKNASDDTKSKLDETLKKAEEVKNNSNATQKEVDDATNNLKQAQNDLDGQTTNKDTLNDAIKDANDAKGTDKYKNASDDTKSKFDDALKKAENVKNDSNATQKEVDDATNNLKNAQNDLDGQATDKSKLDEAITDANNTKSTDKYKNASDDTKSKFDEALKKAEEVKNNSNATQKEVDDAVKNLKQAQNDLDGQTTDKSKLDEAIKSADDTKSTDKYNNASDDTKSKFDEALKKAEEVKNNSNATQKEVDDATKNLKQAQNDLDGQTTNKDAINDAIKDANNAKGTDKYNNASDDTKSKFDDALKKAEDVKNDSNANQKEVDDATKNLKNTLNNLKGQPAKKANLIASKDNAKIHKQTLLPQTGTETNPLTAIGIGLMALGAGIFAKKKRKDDEA